ncbi:hypothetical protein F8B43_4572 [Methylorubrum populi]|uniref:Uncharacterized protein n=1 Tax=Methylorubrum populi TaxID=223967 RepID=A0A833J270_9HYPH|nr:hypothetical protein F8B43_4572 [Methylorubrum populi]
MGRPDDLIDGSPEPSCAFIAKPAPRPSSRRFATPAMPLPLPFAGSAAICVQVGLTD